MLNRRGLQLLCFSLFSVVFLFFLLSRPVVMSPLGRYVFIDLGANKGDSLEVFLNQGRTLTYPLFPVPTGMQPKDAHIYLFEANPKFNKDLEEVKERLQKEGMKINIYPSSPVWINATTMSMWVDPSEHAAATNLKPSMNTDAVANDPNMVTVTTIDFSKFLLDNFTPRDFVVIKMDIETVEYDLLTNIAETGAYSVVDYVFVEFHHWLINKNDPRIKSTNRAVNLMKSKGVKFPPYYSVA